MFYPNRPRKCDFNDVKPYDGPLRSPSLPKHMPAKLGRRCWDVTRWDSKIAKFGVTDNHMKHTCFFPSFNEKPPIFGTKKQGRSPKSFSEIHPDLPKSTAFFTFRFTLQAWPSEPSEDVVDGIMDPLERQEVLASLGFRCAFGSPKNHAFKSASFF